MTPTPAPDPGRDAIAWQALLAELDAQIMQFEHVQVMPYTARAALAARLATAEGGE